MACMQRNFICPIFYNVFKLSLNKKKILEIFSLIRSFHCVCVRVCEWMWKFDNLKFLWWWTADSLNDYNTFYENSFAKVPLSLFLILSHSKTSLESLKCDECKNSLSLKDWMWIIKFDLNQHLQWISMALIHCLLSTPGMAFKMIEIIWKHT